MVRCRLEEIGQFTSVMPFSIFGRVPGVRITCSILVDIFNNLNGLNVVECLVNDVSSIFFLLCIYLVFWWCVGLLFSVRG